MASKFARAGSMATAGLAMAVGIATAPTAQAAEYTMKFALLTINDAQHHFADAAAKAIEKATNGRIEVKVFPRGQLGSASAEVQGLQLGTIEAFEAPVDFFVGVDPRAGVFSIPFLFHGLKQCNEVMQDKKVYDSALNLLDSHGIVGGMVAGQAVGYYIAREPLRQLSDFKGKKMRVNATDAERLRMKLLGATAIPMGLAEMVTSLQNGTIDGTMSGMTIHVNFHLESVSKVLLKTDDTMLVSYTGISKKWLDTLPPDLRKTVVQTMRGMQPQFIAFANEDDEVLTKKWLALGGSFITWSKADMTKFHQLIDGVGDVVTRQNPELHAYYETVKGISSRYH